MFFGVPLGGGEVSLGLPVFGIRMNLRDVVWITSALVIAVVYIIWHTQKNRRRSIEVVELQFDRHSRRIELTVENLDTRPINIKSALRLIRYKQGDSEFISDGVPMMMGRVQPSNILGFDLIASDEHPVFIRGNTQDKLVYVVPENIILKPQDNIKVDLYSDDGYVSTVVPVKSKQELVDIARKVDQDIEKIIGQIDKRIDFIEKKELTESDEIKKFKLIWEENVLRDIEKKLLTGKERVDDSISHLIGFTYGVGLSVNNKP